MRLNKLTLQSINDIDILEQPNTFMFYETEDLKALYLEQSDFLDYRLDTSISRNDLELFNNINNQLSILKTYLETRN